MTTQPTPSHDEVVQRVERALEHRATTEVAPTVPTVLGRRLAQVRAAAGDDVVSLDGDGSGDAGQPRWRRPVTVVAAAASVALLVAVGVGVARWGGSSSAPVAPAEPAPSSSPVDPVQLWAGLWEMSHDQWATEERGDALFGDDIVPGSARLVTQVGGYDYWGAFIRDGQLCWTVEGPGEAGGGCVQPPTEAAPEPVRVSDGSVASQVWLVPHGTPAAATDPLVSDGVLEVASGVWVDAGALVPPPPLGMFERFRQPATAADEVPPDSAIVVRDPLVPGSSRLLDDGDTGTYYLAHQTLGRLCLHVSAPYPGVSGSTCQSPQRLAGEGFSAFGKTEASSGTAWVVADDVDTSAWSALGRTQLAPNLWYEELQPAPRPTPTPDADPAPAVEEAPQPTYIPAEPGSAVPELLGHTEAEAATVLTTYYGLRVGRVVVQDAGSAPSGIVVKTSPAAGEVVEDGGAVDLFTSR